MLDLPILRIATKALLPFIFMFGFYVLFHGEISPGGGFQAGVIFASAIILYSLVFGKIAALQFASSRRIISSACTGVATYLCVGVYGIISGENFLNYNVMAENPHKGQAIAIMLVETGIALTVAAAMISIFFHLARREMR